MVPPGTIIFSKVFHPHWHKKLSRETLDDWKLHTNNESHCFWDLQLLRHCRSFYTKKKRILVFQNNKFQMLFANFQGHSAKLQYIWKINKHPLLLFIYTVWKTSPTSKRHGVSTALFGLNDSLQAHFHTSQNRPFWTMFLGYYCNMYWAPCLLGSDSGGVWGLLAFKLGTIAFD